MSALTIFLGKLIGIYCLIVGLPMIANRQTMIDAVNALIRSPPLVLLARVFAVAVGLGLVIGHNVWSGGALPVVVTAVGHHSSKALHFWPFHRGKWQIFTRHCDTKGIISHTSTSHLRSASTRRLLPLERESATPTALLAESPFSVFPSRGPSNRFFCRGDQARPEICAFPNLKEQTATFRDWSKATAHLGAAMSRKPTGSRISPHQQATKPGQLPNVLQQDLRAYFELARALPHSMLTLLMQLTNCRRTSRPKRRGRTKRR